MAFGSLTLLGPLNYARSGHYLDGLPYSAVEKLSLHSGIAYYADGFESWNGPVGKTTTQLTGWIFNAVNGTGTASALALVDGSALRGAIRLLTGTANSDDALLNRGGEAYKYIAGS